MVKTLLDGFPDDPWHNEDAKEIDAIVNDIEKQLSEARYLGEWAVNGALFDLDYFVFEQAMARNDPYYRTHRLNLN